MSETEYLTTKEAAGVLFVVPSRVRQLALAGQLPGWKAGRDWMFARADVEALARRPRDVGRPRKGGRA